MNKPNKNKVVVVIGYGITEHGTDREGNPSYFGKEYGIHKNGCKDIKKTMQKYYNSHAADYLESGMKNKSGKVCNAYFPSLQDALERLYQEPINENEVLDGYADEHIFTTNENIEIFNCAK